MIVVIMPPSPHIQVHFLHFLILMAHDLSLEKLCPRLESSVPGRKGPLKGEKQQQLQGQKTEQLAGPCQASDIP